MSATRALIALACLSATAPTTPAGDADTADSLRTVHRELFERRIMTPAIAAAEQEVQLRRAQSSISERASALHDLGVYVFHGGNYERAVLPLEEALALRRAEFGDSDLRVAETLTELIPIWTACGKHELATHAVEEALRIRTSSLGEEHPATLKSRYWLALRQDNVPVLREILSIQMRLLGPDHDDIAETMLNLANTTSESDGEYAQMETLGRAGVAMYRRLHGPDDLRVAGSLFLLALYMNRVGEPDETMDLLRESLAIYEKQCQAHYMIIKCRNGLAMMNKDLGHYEEAARLMEQTIESSQLLYQNDSEHRVLLTQNLAVVYGQLGRFERADSLLTAALERAYALRERRVDVEYGITQILRSRAKLAMWQGAYADAGARMQEVLKRHLSDVDAAHPAVVADYVFLASTQAGVGDLAGALNYLDDAVRTYEVARTRTGPGTRAATFRETPHQLRALCRLQLGQTELAWEDLERGRGRLLGESLPGNTGSYPLTRVQRSLREGEAIVGWLDEELPEGTPHAYAYVIRSRGAIDWTRLPCDRTEIRAERSERYTSFRDAMVEAGASGFAIEADFSRAEAQRLWRERLAPLQQQLQGVTTLILVPSDAMAALPVDALVDAQGTFVGERYAIRQAASASVHAWLSEQSHGSEVLVRSALLVGDPPFRAEHLANWSPDAVRPTVASLRATPQTLRSALRSNPAALGALPRLPWSRQEVRTIAALLPQATLLVGVDASRAAVVKLAASDELARFDILHFATHALVDNVQPDRSALVLAQVRDHGVITAAEIDGWHLNAELVTLSGCETALGRHVDGEGTIGFAYPLLRAGARSLLASRWAVNDEATALLIGRFYRNWLGNEGAPGVAKVEALREAKLWLRHWRDESGALPFAHPYYWASFVLVGN